MDALGAQTFVSVLALVGMIILISALLSGLIERSGLPQVAVFLALGAALGPAGLGWLDITLQSPVLRVVATLSLVLVLFNDAVTIDLSEVRRYSKIASLVLGPGTLLSATLYSLAGWLLLGLPPAAAVILGAALASTDPVMLRGLLHRRGTPTAAKSALRLESGLNDIVVLPVVLVAMEFLGRSGQASAGDWAHLGLDLFLLGPFAGVIVGLFAVATLDLVRRRVGIRRDYEALYSIGVAFSAYAAAEAVHGSGFLAAFAAGLTISVMDVELCDCFLEYGEATAEMALLFTFVLFGSSLIWNGFSVLSAATLLFAVIVLFLRPALLMSLLARLKLDRPSRYLIAWFGPRGLSSLLLVLLPVFNGLPGSEELFAICCLVVLLSVVMHGGTLMVLAQTKLEPKPSGTLPSPADETVAEQPEEKFSPVPEPPGEEAVEYAPESEPGPVPEPEPEPIKAPVRIDSKRLLPMIKKEHVTLEDPVRITIDELRKLWKAHEPVLIVDARTERSNGHSETQAARSIRLIPDHVIERAKEMQLPHGPWIVLYCT